MYDMIVIGAGPAGLTTALYAHRAGQRVLVLEGAAPGGQALNTPHVENWPGTVTITGPDFAMGLYQQALALKIPIVSKAATGLEIAGETRRVLCGETAYEAPVVIVATGLLRRKLDVDGEERLAGHGVSYCAICDGNFFRGREVAVVGGGNTALEDALYLAGICSAVWLVHRRDSFRGEEYLVRQVERRENIHLLLSHQVQSVEGERAVERLKLTGPAGPQEISVSGVFVAVGFQPGNGAFAPPLEVDAGGFLLAAEDCITAIPGVFAAGDCRVKEFRQLITAAADGAIAASKAGQYLLKQG